MKVIKYRFVFQPQVEGGYAYSRIDMIVPSCGLMYITSSCGSSNTNSVKRYFINSLKHTEWVIDAV